MWTTKVWKNAILCWIETLQCYQTHFNCLSMIRQRLHCRFSSSSYLRRKVNQSSYISVSDQQNLQGNDYGHDDDSTVESEFYQSDLVDEETDMGIVTPDYDYCGAISRLLHEVNISDSAQRKIYNFIRQIARERVYLPSFNEYDKQIQQKYAIRLKKFLYCDLCITFTLNSKTCECVSEPGELRVFNLRDTINLLVRLNKEYLMTSNMAIARNNNGAFVGSKRYSHIWQDTEGQDLIRITLIFNIDDASFVKSTRTTSTPISFVIAELPEHRRYCKMNVSISGLWWGHTKVKYDYLWLHSVTKEMDESSSFQMNIDDWSTPCVVRIGAIVTDSVAKPKIMNIMQFNGSYGCPYCFHPGVSMPTRRGGTTMCYPCHENAYELKNHDFYVDAGSRALEAGNANMGVKGPCSLSQFIKIPDSFPIDYMHCVLEGVFKTLLNTKPFNSGPVINKIDEIGRKVALPHEFSRKFRSITDLAYWKASECRTFLLFLTPLLKNCVDSDSFHLIISLSTALRLLTSSTMCNHDISMGEDLIKAFISAYQKINGEESMRFNIHLLTHLADQAKNMGSLSNTSSFVFEDNIFKIKRTFHGNRGQNAQMADRYIRFKSLQINDNNIGWPHQNAFEGPFHLIGSPVGNKVIVPNILRMLMSRFGHISTTDITVYTRVKKNHIIYHSIDYKFRRKSASYNFHYLDKNSLEKKYGEIQYFIHLTREVTSRGHDMIFTVFREYINYHKQSLFTGLDKLKILELKMVPTIVKNAQLFHKVKRSDKINLLELRDIVGKAIVAIDSIAAGTYYATAIDSMFEHD